MNDSFSAETWAVRLANKAELGHRSRNTRLAGALTTLCAGNGTSIVERAGGDAGRVEQLYRFARGEAIEPEAVLEAGYAFCAETAERTKGDLLALSDTTTLSYHHRVKEDLGDLGGGGQNHRGWFVHNVLLVEEGSQTVVGLADQHWWSRDPASRGKRAQRKSLPPEEKESAKWEAACERTEERLTSVRERLVFIADREADVFSHLMNLIGQELRFVLRACWNRRVETEHRLLRETVLAAPLLGRGTVDVEQRGGRAARTAFVEYRSCTLTLRPPFHNPFGFPPLTVNAALVHEPTPPEGAEPLEWLLLTSEPVQDRESTVRVARKYAARWLVEEYHKCWKSGGMHVEGLRMQTPDNLQRMATLMALGAVWLMRLRGGLLSGGRCRIDGTDREESDDASPGWAERWLPDGWWEVLWVSVEKSPPPAESPSRVWCMRAVAKLGGWLDTKRTGRPGYRVLWRGWTSLAERVEVIRLHEEINKQIK